MYATTIIYPLSSAPEKYQWIIALNPMTAIIETLRYGFLGTGSFSWSFLGYSIIITLFILTAGVLVFNKVEKDFVDTV
jgi:lipopolysaccharide transport system permease protein